MTALICNKVKVRNSVCVTVSGSIQIKPTGFFELRHHFGKFASENISSDFKCSLRVPSPGCICEVLAVLLPYSFWLSRWELLRLYRRRFWLDIHERSQYVSVLLTVSRSNCLCSFVASARSRRSSWTRLM